MRYTRILLQPLSRHRTSVSQNLVHHNSHNSPCNSIYSRYTSTSPNFRENGRPFDFNFPRGFTSSAQERKVAPSERVSVIVDEITGLTLLEMADLVEVLRKKMDIKEMPGMAFMMPGMGFGAKGGAKGGGPAKEEKKAEKTSFDLKLEGGFDASVKIKIIKEVRACTELGLKEAKDLVEKAPTLLKKGVPKEEAEKIIAKMKEVGAKVIME